jgi:hypothetical protein
MANVMQDAVLRVADMPDPKYLPNILGGCNCPASFQDPINTYLYMKAYKGGAYDRLYGTAVQEAMEAIRLTENGQPTQMLIAAALRDNHDYLFATMRNIVVVPPAPLKEEQRTRLPAPLYEAAGVKNEIASVESRLIRARKLVPRTQAQILYNRKVKIEEVLFTSLDIKLDSEQARALEARAKHGFQNALRGNSAFVNLATRKGCDGDVTKLIRKG